MSCQECARLRRKISPLEDADFTANYRLVEPVAWYATQGKGDKISIRLNDAWSQAFGTRANPHELTVLGRTLEALGWNRTYSNGLLRFTMGKQEYLDVYDTTRD